MRSEAPGPIEVVPGACEVEEVRDGETPSLPNLESRVRGRDAVSASHLLPVSSSPLRATLQSPPAANSQTCAAPRERSAGTMSRSGQSERRVTNVLEKLDRRRRRDYQRLLSIRFWHLTKRGLTTRAQVASSVHRPACARRLRREAGGNGREKKSQTQSPKLPGWPQIQAALVRRTSPPPVGCHWNGIVQMTRPDPNGLQSLFGTRIELPRMGL
jgi:hypothetical protein